MPEVQIAEDGPQERVRRFVPGWLVDVDGGTFELRGTRERRLSGPVSTTDANDTESPLSILAHVAARPSTVACSTGQAYDGSRCAATNWTAMPVGPSRLS